MTKTEKLLMEQNRLLEEQNKLVKEQNQLLNKNNNNKIDIDKDSNDISLIKDIINSILYSALTITIGLIITIDYGLFFNNEIKQELLVTNVDVYFVITAMYLIITSIITHFKGKNSKILKNLWDINYLFIITNSITCVINVLFCIICKLDGIKYILFFILYVLELVIIYILSVAQEIKKSKDKSYIVSYGSFLICLITLIVTIYQK